MPGYCLSSFPHRSFGAARLPGGGPARSLAAMTSTGQANFRVLIVGGGVAAIEAALALRDLAGDRVRTTMLAPEPDFVYRPLRVREPFAGPTARRYPLAAIARDLGVELKQDALNRLDAAQRIAYTDGGDALPYDAILLALGARARSGFEHALTLDDQQLDEQLHGLIQDVEEGYTHKLAFIVPSQMPWPLPIYELALMTAQRAFDMNVEVSVTVVTSEPSPLAVFGTVVSDAVEALLVRHGILLIPSAHCDTPEPRQVSIRPGGRRLYVDRVIALPELYGPSLPGVPSSDAHGFIPVDSHCQVRNVDAVYAAGDATDFPVKHGGIAAQQAVVAARSIAALAGARVEPAEFHPVIRGMLLGAERPLYISAHLTGGHGTSSVVSEEPTWLPATKIASTYLAPYLESFDQAAVR